MREPHTPMPGPDGDPNPPTAVAPIVYPSGRIAMRQIQLDAIEAAANVLWAADRRVMVDLVASWRHLKTLLAIDLPTPTLLNREFHARPDHSDSQFIWQQIRELVGAAVRNINAIDMSRHWYTADCYLRSVIAANTSCTDPAWVEMRQWAIGGGR